MESAEPTEQVRLRTRPPSALACVACRSRHVKCNGQMPVCKRCQDNGSECSYKQSRRGYKGPRKTKPRVGGSDSGHVSKDATRTDFAASPFTIGSSADLGDHDYDLTPNFAFGLGEEAFLTKTSLEQDKGNSDAVPNLEQLLAMDNGEITDVALRSHVPNFLGSPGQAITAEYEVFMDIFYASFNDAHPFLIPKKLYRKKPSLIPPHLKRVIHFLASHFMPTGSQENIRWAAEKITSEQAPNDGYKVQGLMLLGMALFSRSEQPSGVAAFDQAIDLALQLGMNSAAFASNNGMNNAVVEESWRRTWWELYMVDGILASLNSIRHTFRLQHVQNDMTLPYEDCDYAQCNKMPSLRSQSDFRERTFAAEKHSFSSMAYKIEAVRLLGEAIRLEENSVEPSDDAIETLDASLANFIISLPAEKTRSIEREGKLDEVIFMAQSIIDCALILLHRPRSTLVSIRNHYPTHCTREKAISAPTSAYEVHTSKAIKAANSISASVTVRTPLANHSPCFICAIAMAAVVHLPAYAQEPNTDRAGQMKERLQLGISALDSIGAVWPSARAAKGLIAQFAREIFAAQKVTAGSRRVEAQVQELAFESMINDQIWLDDLVNFESDENTMMLEGAPIEPLSVGTDVVDLPI